MTRRGLQITLGVLWLLDAGLQFQPYMFTTKFAVEVIDPAGAGQVPFVSTPIEHVVNVISAHPAPYNAVFASVQLAIGLGLLLRRTVVPALVASIVWSLSVWYLGEGLGGLTGHNPALLAGAPGAALLYAILAVAAWPNNHKLPASWLVFAWAGYWVGGAILQVWRGPRIGPDLAATVSESANGAPGWLSRIDFSLARTLGHVSPGFVAGWIGVQVLIGLAAFAPRRARRIAVLAGCLIAVGFWIIGPGFDQLISGHGTDPNTPPLVVIIGVAIFAYHRRSHVLGMSDDRRHDASADDSRFGRDQPRHGDAAPATVRAT
ncbi:MAG TPA: hypothetical protein VGD55_05590 [Acidothermaceae bacterium]